MTEKNVISAVHDDDLVGFLKGLGVLAEVERGRAKCKFCREAVTLDNLAAVFPESGDVKFVCDKPGCLKKLAESRVEMRGAEPTPGKDDLAAEADANIKSANHA